MTGKQRNRVLLLVSISISLLLAELFLARFHPQPTEAKLLSDNPAMNIASNIIDVETMPNFRGHLRRKEFETTIELNSLGHRQAEFDLDKGDRFRVLVIGDSFTFGWGVEAREAYPLVLERWLDAASRESVEVINAGSTGGFYPDAYYLYMGERGLALHPDLVLVGFYIGNDIDGPAARARIWPEVDRDGLPLRVVHREMHVEDNRWVRKERSLWYRIPVLKNSHLAQLLYSAGKRVVKAGKPLKKQLKKYRIYETVYEQKTEENVDRVKKLFIGMARIARAHDIGFAVVMIPTREQVYPQRYQDIVDIDLEKPQRIFSEFFADQGIVVLDLLPIMRAAADDRPLYYQHDSHWRSAGQALAGREIGEFLVRQRLVPDGS